MALFPNRKKTSLVGTAESRAGSCITDFDINTLSPALNDWEGPDQTFPGEEPPALLSLGMGRELVCMDPEIFTDVEWSTESRSCLLH